MRLAPVSDILRLRKPKISLTWDKVSGESKIKYSDSSHSISSVCAEIAYKTSNTRPDRPVISEAVDRLSNAPGYHSLKPVGNELEGLLG